MSGTYPSPKFQNITCFGTLTPGVNSFGTTIFPMSPYQFGAKGDGVTNDTTAINEWLAWGALGNPLYASKGTYLYTGGSALTFDLTGVSNTGFSVDGAGRSQAIFDCRGVTVSPQVNVLGSAGGNNINLALRGMGFYTNTAGIGFNVGDVGFTQSINGIDFDIEVQNFSTANTAVGVNLNYVIFSRGTIIADVAGAGVALKCQQVAFCNFNVSVSAILGVGIYITNGFNYGNLWLTPDIENVLFCVQIDSPTAISNTFMGGTWNWFNNGATIGCGIYFTAGVNNVIFSPNLAPSAPATLSSFIKSAIGLLLMAHDDYGVVAPAMPVSGTLVVNNTGQLICVVVWGGVVTNVLIQGINPVLSSGTFILKPGDSIGFTYTSTPTWIWYPLP